MKKKYVLFFLILFFSLNKTVAATITSAASGNWNSGSTWVGGQVPLSTDDVIITNYVVTVTSNQTCNSLTTNPGIGGIGSAGLVVNGGFKLTVTAAINVLATQLNNETYFSGSGLMQAVTLNVGQTNFIPTAEGLVETTLFVDDLTEFKITGNISISTRIHTVEPIKTNAARLRHRSGTIDLNGSILAVNTRISDNFAQNTIYGDLGFRTDNVGQGISKIIFRAATSLTTGTGNSTSNFTGATVEFLNEATTNYNLPALPFFELILNSPRNFTSTNANTQILAGGKLVLSRGVLTSNNTTGTTALMLNNNVEIIRSGGSINSTQPITGGFLTRLRAAQPTNLFTVTYKQHASKIPAGRELFVVNGSSVINPSVVNIQSSNGVLFGEDFSTGQINVSATSSNSVNSTVEVKEFKAESTCSMDGAGKINVSKVLNVTNGSTFNVQDNMLTLLSGLAGTARVAPLLQNEIVNGIVNVQRYYENNKRQWRLLTSPVKGSSNNSVFYNWQLNGVADFSNGVDIWGPNGSMTFDPNDLSVTDQGNGLVQIFDSNHNLRKWNNLSGNFSNVTQTLDEPLFNSDINHGFLGFFTHPFLRATIGDGFYDANWSSLNLSAAGSLITGNVLYNDIVNTKYYMIGNPYASPINFGTMLADSDNQGVKKIWVIDPTVGQFGSYVTYDAVAGVYNNSGSSFNGSTVLQSGQAFFVLAAGTGSLITTSLTIKESHKSTASTNATLNRSVNTKTAISSALFRILLEKDNGAGYTNMDGCVAVFYEGGSNAIDGNDGYKLSNPGENISLFNTSNFSIEHRAPIQDADFLTLRVTQAIVGANYKLKLFTENFTFAGTAYLEDSFLGTSTPIALNGSVFEYVYQVTSSSASSGNRFKIVFKQNETLSVDSVDSSNFSIYPNPLSSNESINLQFNSKQIGNSFSYQISSILGQQVAHGDFVVSSGSTRIPLDDLLSTGIYIFQVRNRETNEQFSKKLIIK